MKSFFADFCEPRPERASRPTRRKPDPDELVCEEKLLEAYAP